MTPRKEKALQALLVSRTRAEAAQAAGIGESTLRSYMQDAEFMERYKEAFGDMVRDATRQAQQTLSPALSTLRMLSDNCKNGAGAVLRAWNELEGLASYCSGRGGNRNAATSPDMVVSMGKWWEELAGQAIENF